MSRALLGDIRVRHRHRRVGRCGGGDGWLVVTATIRPVRATLCGLRQLIKPIRIVLEDALFDGIRRVARQRLKWRVALVVAGDREPPPCASAGAFALGHGAAVPASVGFKLEFCNTSLV